MAAAIQSSPSLVSLSDRHSLRLRTASVSSSASGGTVGSKTSRDDDTITGDFRTLIKGKQRSNDDLRLLAVSAQLTEIGYSISDIQTRIFEIQELRHHDLGSSEVNGSSSSTSLTSVIDQALVKLDERLESVAQSIVATNATLEPFLNPQTSDSDSSHVQVDEDLARKHAGVLADWETVRSEAEMLRDELKEDKWLAVFRNASDQADGMMNSLEKVVNQCQDFIWQIYRRYQDESRSQVSSASERVENLSIDTFTQLHKSLEAKKKYYMPSVTKVLSVLDKGVRDRVTKNGESLRRHADMRIRWKELRGRIAKIDADMDNVYRLLLEGDHEASEAESSVSYLAPNSAAGFNTVRSRTSSTTSAVLADSISPFRKFAARMARSSGKNSSSADPSSLNTPIRPSLERNPHSTDSPMRKRSSFFGLRQSYVGSPSEKNSHRYSTSVQLTPSRESAESNRLAAKPSIPNLKPRWNASPHPLPELPVSTIKQPSPSGRASLDPNGYGLSRVPSTPGTRSSSRMSQAPPSVARPTPPVPPRNPSRPTPPVSGSPYASRPLSRQAPARAESRQAPARSDSRQGQTYARSDSRQAYARTDSRLGYGYTRPDSRQGVVYAPRNRPTTPSQIPAPNFLHVFNHPDGRAKTPLGTASVITSEGGSSEDHDTPTMATFMRRAMTPSTSTSTTLSTAATSPEPTPLATPRKSGPGSPSKPPVSGTGASGGRHRQSLLPVPRGGLRAPSPALSHAMSISPPSSMPLSRRGAQTPETPYRTQPYPLGIPATPSPSGNVGSVPRGILKLSSSVGPSSFRGDASTYGGSSSRPSSQSQSYQDGLSALSLDGGIRYVPAAGNKDPLDLEVARVVNGLSHLNGLQIERVDPPLKKAPAPGEEVKAQYAISNAFGRKVINCRLVVVQRKGGAVGDEHRKVVCRVGGGWQDLEVYLLSRQAT